MRGDIAEGLIPMFKEAREKGLWFHCAYQDLWFSPDQLAERQANGQFCWGAVNWTLRDPQERVQEAQRRADSAAAYARRVAEEV